MVYQRHIFSFHLSEMVINGGLCNFFWECRIGVLLLAMCDCFTTCPFHQNTFTIKYQTWSCWLIFKFNFRCFLCPLFVLMITISFSLPCSFPSFFKTITSYAHTACLHWGDKGIRESSSARHIQWHMHTSAVEVFCSVYGDKGMKRSWVLQFSLEDVTFFTQRDQISCLRAVKRAWPLTPRVTIQSLQVTASALQSLTFKLWCLISLLKKSNSWLRVRYCQHSQKFLSISWICDGSLLHASLS